MQESYRLAYVIVQIAKSWIKRRTTFGLDTLGQQGSKHSVSTPQNVAIQSGPGEAKSL